MFVNAKQTVQHRSGDGPADGDAGILERVPVPKFEPPELNKASHTMRNLAKVKNAPVIQAAPYPAPKRVLALGLFMHLVVGSFRSHLIWMRLEISRKALSMRLGLIISYACPASAV